MTTTSNEPEWHPIGDDGQEFVRNGVAIDNRHISIFDYMGDIAILSLEDAVELLAILTAWDMKRRGETTTADDPVRVRVKGNPMADVRG